MKIGLIGATGRTGRLLLPILLQRGHHITVLVRDPAALGPVAQDTALTVVTGDARNPDALHRLTDGVSVIRSHESSLLGDLR